MKWRTTIETDAGDVTTDHEGSEDEYRAAFVAFKGDPHGVMMLINPDAVPGG